MILYIDTTQGHGIEIVIKDDKKILARKKITAPYRQAEKLLPFIDKTLKQKKIGLKDIKEIKVANRGKTPASGRGTSFTALRIGVVTANALGYALGVPVESEVSLPEAGKKPGFNIVKPIYDREPNITIKTAK